MLSERVREVEIELFAKQNEAIRLLSEANYELVSLLRQHAPGEDLAPMISKTKRAEEALGE